jgi:glycosyltransferase involved in cell wall biosynthesis
MMCFWFPRQAGLLETAGFKWRPFAIERKGTNPLAELAAIWRLARLYRELQPQVVHHFTIKPVLYGSIAARHAGVPHVLNAITGLGHVFIDNRPGTRVVRTIVKILYRFSLGGTIVIFQNNDDLKLFTSLGIVQPRQTHLIAGSGVNLKHFAAKTELEGAPVVILPGRLLKTKGVEEFVAAAKDLKRKGTNARFVLVGNTDFDNPSSVTREELEGWQTHGSIEWWGWRDDMNTVFAQANIICLPSYREGLSRTLLEAAASGRALVATDVPGCRDIVHNNENGFLVPVRNVPLLAKALEQLIQNPGLRHSMGLRGRQIVEENFSEQTIIEQTIRLYPGK